MENKDNLHYIYDEIVGLYGNNFIKYLPNILTHIANYLNKAMDVLCTKNVGLHLIYTSSMENDLYDTCSVEKSEIMRIIKSSYNIKQTIQDATNPIYNFLMILSCFYKQHEAEIMKKYKLKTSPAEFVLIYLGLRIYSISQRQIFHHEPNERVMDYTIDHLSGKFDILKYDNVYALIEDYVKTNNSALEADLSYIEDKDIHEWVSKLIHRYKNICKNVYREFIKNYNSQNIYTNDAITAKNEEGKTFYTQTSSASNDVLLVTTKYANALMGESVVREDIIKLAIKRGATVNPVKLTSLVNEIIHDKETTERLTNIVKNIISFWIVSCGKSAENIHSLEFIKSAVLIYAMSNTKNEYILDVKKILTEAIQKYGASLIDVTKGTTVNAYKQDVYLYIVFYMATVK